MTVHEPFTTPRKLGLSVEDFLILDQSGAFDAYAKTELIDGTIFFVNAQYSEHMRAKVRLLRRLADVCDALGSGLEAWSEGSVDMRPSSMPEPDLFITRETPTTGAVPKETVVLIVEIADTTADFDLGQKAAIYAVHGMPEYWVVDLKKEQIRQMWSPLGQGYAEQRSVALGQPVSAVTIPGITVSTADL